MKIAVYAIALNEAKHVDRFIKACKGADLVVVADTGSTDGTAERLEQLGAVVHRITVKPWRFDDARNAALALVPPDVDVCVSLDLDEVPDDDFFDKLREEWKPETTRAFVFWLTEGEQWANNNRVHTRFGYRWVGLCHEVTVPHMGQVDNEVVIPTIVTHYPDKGKSRAQYLPMLRAAVDENPADARMWNYLIRELYYHKEWAEVIERANVFFEGRSDYGWSIESAASARALGDSYSQLGEPDKSLDWYVKGTELAPNELEAWYPLAHYLSEQGDWQGCWEAASKVLTLERPGHYLVVDSVWQWQCYDLMAQSSWNLGKRGSAKKWARLALENCPKDNPEFERVEGNYKFMATSMVKERING